MTDDEVRRTIDQLERALVRDALEGVEQCLAHDDPAFVRRFHHRCRAEMASAIGVFLLLAVGAVLMTVGFATLSWPAWVAGVLAFLASFGVNAHHDRIIRGDA
jgi:Protein of unknown function (DUF3040)